jgi:hypothetical protein
VAAKLVVTAHEGGSRIALVGASGKELLASVVFSEPRAKGATLRSLKGMLGDAIIVEDHTLASPRGRGDAPETTNGQSAKRVAKSTRRPAARRRSEANSDTPTTTKAAKATAKATKSTAKS